MGSEIVGRTEELSTVEAFLGDDHEQPRMLVLEGEPGIGKSTLWRAGVQAAGEHGFRVLSSRPAEAERNLAHAGLSDLLENVLAEVAPKLPPPRRRALEVALLVEEASDEPTGPRALGVAVRTALEALAEDARVVIAVDDIQWFDPSSISALAFALRRLDDARVLMLFARRLEESAKTELEDAVAPEQRETIRLRPLSVGALHHLLRDRLGRSFPRQTLLRIHDTSDGNPFFALELARALGEDVDPAQPLPVPETLDQLLRDKLAGLPPKTREALDLASAVGEPPESLLEDAGIASEVLNPALAANVIERHRERIRFSHPLLPSALYRDLSPAAKRDIHRRLAHVVQDPLARARHLALATETPQADIAAVLDEASELATQRGASAAAAELAEHAVRLTPSGIRADRHRRTLSASRAHVSAGEWTRAHKILTDLLAGPTTRAARAEALLLLAELEPQARSVALLEEALEEAASDPASQCAIHSRLAWAGRFRGFSMDHANAASDLAERLHDAQLQRSARAVQTTLAWFAGTAKAPDDLVLLAHDFPSAVGGDQLVREGTQAVVNTMSVSAQRAEARALLESEFREWHERDEPRSACALWGLAWLEFWAGRWDRAAEHAERASDISVQYGLEMPQDHLPIAVIAVHRGRLELARQHSERALELGLEQFGLRPPQHMGVLGLASLWSGDQAAALDWFDKAEERAAELMWGEPSLRWWTADHIECLLGVGRHEEAVEILDAWEADAERVGRDWVLAHTARCRGLAAAAEGDVDRAASLLERAVHLHEEVGDPYGHARAQLALGTVRRRERQKRAARVAIQASLAGFEELGATVWIEKARGELGRIGGRRREEGLTPAERRVADLVAEGRTNREVASALFVAERTVASHLSHVYAKLGVRSRTELARRLDSNTEPSKVKTF